MNATGATQPRSNPAGFFYFALTGGSPKSIVRQMPVCELAQDKGGNNNPRGKPAVLSDLLAMQRRIKEDVLNSDCKPSERAMGMRAYVEAEKLKRVMRGLPANTSQSIKSEPKQKRARVSGPVEPVEVIEPIKAPEPVRVSGPVHPTDTQPLLNSPVSQPDAQPAKSTGAWAKAMGEDDPHDQV